MTKNVKALEFTSSKSSHDRKPRFCIVDMDTGEILDDAQGYGYKSPQKAHAAYGYKTRDKTKDKKNRARDKHIQRWLKKHPEVVETLDVYAFEIAKGSWGPDDHVDAALVSEVLHEYGLHPDFTPGKLLRVWKNLYM